MRYGQERRETGLCPRQVDVAGGSGPQVLEFGVQSIRDFRMRAE